MSTTSDMVHSIVTILNARFIKHSFSNNSIHSMLLICTLCFEVSLKNFEGFPVGVKGGSLKTSIIPVPSNSNNIS